MRRFSSGRSVTKWTASLSGAYPKVFMLHLFTEPNALWIVTMAVIIVTDGIYQVHSVR